MELNNDLVNKLKEREAYLRKLREEMVVSFENLKGTSEFESKKEGIKLIVKKIDNSIIEIRDTVKKAREVSKEYAADNSPENELALIEANKELEQLATTYEIDYKNTDEKVVESNEKPEKKKHTVRNVICGVLAASILLGVGYSIGNKSKGKTRNETVIEEVLDEKEGTFTDASDVEQVKARADWYMNTYFNKAYEGLSNVGTETANEETLADCIRVVSGEKTIYQDFETDDLIKYNNQLVQMFCSYLTLSGNDKAGFVPSQYLYEDGSYEQKCAAQVDAILEPLVEAINNKDNESYVKYAKAFGELMRDQYLNVDFTDKNYNVRGMADFSSQIHLYSLAYAEYTNKIMPYGLDNGLDICIPICVDYSTGKTVEYPLSKLMATLEFVPTSQWDAVIARSGYTTKDLEALGNSSTEDPMPVTFTINAKEHYREQNLELKK